jgi:hypothetical protein
MSFIVKLVDGVFKRVTRHTYNGKVHERTYPMDSNVPEDVRVVGNADGVKYNHHVQDAIHNQEYLLYMHYHRDQIGL